MDSFRIRKSSQLNPIIVSLDCHDNATLEIAKDFGDKIETIIEVYQYNHFFSSKSIIPQI